MKRSKAYLAGYNCGFTTPDTKNSHFSFFSTKQSSDEWSAGKKAGEAAKQKRDGAKIIPISAGKRDDVEIPNQIGEQLENLKDIIGDNES